MFGIDPLVLEHLEGLADEGVVWVELAENTKHSIRRWEHYIEKQRRHPGPSIDLAVRILRDGKGLGYLVRGDIWVLDLDTLDGTARMPMRERFESVCSNLYLAPPRIQTPSMGMHGVFRLPDELLGMSLKNHVCHPLEDEDKQEWDFKIGPATLMVAPGTVNEKGTYIPLTRWMKPPVLDPRIMAPQVELFKDLRPFLIDNRDKKSRIRAAQEYLRRHAPIAREGKAGHLALHEVAVTLVVYRDLDPELAYYLMTHEAPGRTPWNERCHGKDGKPSPWSARDLWLALDNSADAVPSVGAKDYETAMEEEAIRGLMGAFIQMLRMLPAASGKASMTATALFQAFQKTSGLNLPKGMASVFGGEIHLAILQGALPLAITRRKGINVYLGVDEGLLETAKSRYEDRQRKLSS